MMWFPAQHRSRKFGQTLRVHQGTGQTNGGVGVVVQPCGMWRHGTSWLRSGWLEKIWEHRATGFSCRPSVFFCIFRMFGVFWWKHWYCKYLQVFNNYQQVFYVIFGKLYIHWGTGRSLPRPTPSVNTEHALLLLVGIHGKALTAS